MPEVIEPSVSIGQTQINTTGTLAVSGLQFEEEHQLITLSDGTLLSVYRVSDGIFFQQLDRLGNAMGPEGQFSTPDYLAEGDFDVLAVENGDVVLAFEAEGAAVPTVRVQSFSIDTGVATATTDIVQSFQAEVDGTETGNFRHASLAGTTTSDVVLQSLTTAADGTQNLTMFTDLDGTSPQSFDTAFPFNQNRSSIDTTVLENGNIVTTVVSFGVGGTNRRFLDFVITEPDGTAVTSGQTRVTDSTNISESEVIALADGGFAVAYAGGDGGDIDLFTRSFDADGTPRLGETTVVFSNNPDSNKNPAMVALPDGGYLVIFDRDNAGGRLIAQRFDADGNKLGGISVIEQGGVATPRATLTEDGLVALTYIEGLNVQIEFLAVEALDIVLSDEADTFTGTVDDDRIEGAGGADTLDGGDGFDAISFAGSSAAVTVNLDTGTGSGGDAQGDVYTNFENILGSAFGDDLTGNSDDNIIRGEAGDDRLDGLGAFDTLEGGAGDDTLRGGAGDDRLDGGAGIDTADYSGSAAVNVSLIAGTGIGGDADGDIFVSIENLIGSSQNDTLTGDEGGNQIDGAAGNDVIDGNRGEDTLNGDAGSDDIRGGDGNDLIDGGADGDQLRGDDGHDTINGGEGNDTLVGGSNEFSSLAIPDDDVVNGGNGNDSISGGNGDDLLNGDDGNDIIDGDRGDDTIDGGIGQDGITGGEGHDLIDGGANDDTIEGNEGNDTLLGGDGADSIAGDSGADIIDGGAGVDIIFAGTGYDTVDGGDGDDLIFGGDDDDSLSGGEGNDDLQGDDGADTLIGGDGEDSIEGGSGDDLLDGGADNDQLDGGSGNDTLDGRTGDDIMSGGSGSDLLFGRSGNDEMRGGSGHDSLFGSDGFDTLAGGDGNDLLDGGEGNDILDGDAGNDTLIGGLGADELSGGSGFDTADYSFSAAGITINLTGATSSTGGEAQGDTFLSIEGVIGTGFNDAITGDVARNTLIGGNGNDVLDGAANDDLLEGGAGDDLLIGGAGSDTILGGDGVDTVRFAAQQDTFSLFFDAGGRLLVTDESGAVDVLEGVEFLEFTDRILSFGPPTNGNDDLTGSDGDDTIDALAGDDVVFGLGGNDLLDGGQGSDTLNGGLGDDRFLVDVSSDVVIEAAGEGQDTIVSTADSFSLLTNGENVEELILAGTSDIDAIGNALDNIILGNAGNNVILGAAGADQLIDGGGNDVLNGGGGDDTAIGGAGSDTVVGGAGKDLLNGGGGDDLALGGSGSDMLVGGGGNDVLNGGGGTDTANGGSGSDTIVGGGGNDLLLGGSGDDVINGGSGADIIDGGAGNDTLRGGADAQVDVFVFGDNSGIDTILDFDIGVDQLDFCGMTEITDFADLQANHMTQTGNDVMITDGTTSITLADADINDLGATDFIF